MDNKKFVAEILKKGCKIERNILDFRTQDCTDWWDAENPLLVVSCGKRKISLICVGDIRIYAKRKEMEFIYKGGAKHWGKLTPYLKKHGLWENNNWFEVIDTAIYEPSIFYNLDDAAMHIIEVVKDEG